jgi:hypothetical protein
MRVHAVFYGVVRARPGDAKAAFAEDLPDKDGEVLGMLALRKGREDAPVSGMKACLGMKGGGEHLVAWILCRAGYGKQGNTGLVAARFYPQYDHVRIVAFLRENTNF